MSANGTEPVKLSPEEIGRRWAAYLLEREDALPKPPAERPCLAGLCDRVYCDHMPDGSKR